MDQLKGTTGNPYFRQVMVAFGPIVITGLLGMSEGYSSVLLPQLRSPNSTIQIDTETASLIASITALPMSGGCILGGYLMEKIGRKTIHLLACIPLILGWFIIAAAQNTTFILIGRFLTGVSDGLLGPPTCVYIAETCHPKIRGVLSMSTVVSITIGVLSIHLLGTFYTWSLTAFISGLLPIPIIILMLFVPESPTYLVKKKKIDEARKSFYWCRGVLKESREELEQLITRQELLNNAPKIPGMQQLKNLYVPEFWKPTLIISILFFTAQITGNNAIASYSIKIIQECGLTGDNFNEYFAMITIDVCRCFASIISCILVSKMSRRALLMFSGYGVVISLVFLCSYLYISAKNIFSSPIFLLISLVAYVCMISIGLVPLSWTMMGEMFPVAHRGLGSAFSSLVCYFFLYLVVKTFPYLLEMFGNIMGVFIVYGSFTLCGTIFLTIFLPETKNKPLYVIEDYFKSKKNRKPNLDLR